MARTRPASSTTMWSAATTVDSRWAIDQHRAAGGRPGDGVAQRLLVDRVELRRRLVEQQQARPAQQRAGDRDALALAARERGAALADGGVEAVGEPRHELVEPVPRPAPRAARPRWRRARRSARSRAACRRTPAPPARRSRSSRRSWARGISPAAARRAGSSPRRGRRTVRAARTASSCRRRTARRWRSGRRGAGAGSRRRAPAGGPAA